MIEERFPIAGGLAATTSFALAERVGRHRRRAAVEQAAAPCWRPVGTLWVVTTDLRLAVLRDGSWSSIWLNSVLTSEPIEGCDGFVLTFPDDPPYALLYDEVRSARS